MKFALVLFFALASSSAFAFDFSAWSANAPAPGTYCQKNTDCPLRTCDNGYCQTKQCSGPADCAVDQVCWNVGCIPRFCKTTNDCAVGGTCGGGSCWYGE